MSAHTQNPEIQGHGFRNLLFFLLLYLVGSPFLVPYPSLAIIVHLSLSITLFAAVGTGSV